jgi:hypothetical protein
MDLEVQIYKVCFIRYRLVLDASPLLQPPGSD